MDVAYEESVTDFNKGLKRNQGDTAAAEKKEIGTHGGRIPSTTEATRIFEEKGMPWREVVAVSSILSAFQRDSAHVR